MLYVVSKVDILVDLSKIENSIMIFQTNNEWTNGQLTTNSKDTAIFLNFSSVDKNIEQSQKHFLSTVFRDQGEMTKSGKGTSYI